MIYPEPLKKALEIPLENPQSEIDKGEWALCTCPVCGDGGRPVGYLQPQINEIVALTLEAAAEIADGIGLAGDTSADDGDGADVGRARCAHDIVTALRSLASQIRKGADQ